MNRGPNQITRLLEKNQTAEARQLIQEARAVMGANDPQVNLLIASTYKREHRFQLTLRYAEKVLQVEPKNPHALLFSIESLLHLGRAKEAEQHARRAIKIKKAHDRAKCYLASSLVAQGKPRHALKIIRTIIKAHPQDQESLLIGAFAADDLQRNKEALKYLEPLLRKAESYCDEDKLLLFRLAADNAFAINENQDLYLKLAARYYKAILAMCPSDTRSIWGLAACYVFQNKMKQAKTLREQMATMPKLSKTEQHALRELDDLLDQQNQERKKELKELRRRRAHRHFLTTANAITEQINILLKSLETIGQKIIAAVKANKLSPPPPAAGFNETRALHDSFQKQVLALNDAWEDKTLLPVAQLNRTANQLFESGRKVIANLRANVESAQEYYRPIEISRGH